MTGKKHSSEEMVAKMAQANSLAARGKTVREICGTLDISVMTLHRWKKKETSIQNSSLAMSGEAISAGISEANKDLSIAAVERLEHENTKLRELLVELLLEKDDLLEKLRGGQGISIVSGYLSRQR